MKYPVLNFLLFQAAWFGCALGVGNNLPEIAYTTLFIVISLHLGFSNNRKRDTQYLIMIAIIGTTVDSALGGLGVLDFHKRWFCPPWLTGLWMAFAATIHYSLSWLKQRPVLGSVLGAIGGPASYYAGAKFGALQLNPDVLYSLAVLVPVWSVVVPLMLLLANDRRGILFCTQK